MILALDMATCVGWCAGDGSALPIVGHVRLPPPVEGERGPMFARFRNFLVDLIGRFWPSLVVGEKPILPKPFIKRDARGKPFIFYPTKIETTLILQGLWAILEEVCETFGIPCRGVDIATVKRELAGTGKAEKPDMVAAAERVGLEIAVHDEADAFGAWLCGVQRTLPRAIGAEWDRRVWRARGALL